MTEQEYIWKPATDFHLKHIFECGQCFRWNRIGENTYQGVCQFGVLVVEQITEDTVCFRGLCEGNLKEHCHAYFALTKDYASLKKELSQVDEYLAGSIAFGSGIRILNQDLWEMLISFIVSANNNIPRIKGILERMAIKYGSKVTWKGKDFYLFPTPEQLAKASVADLRALGLGFRDKRIYETTQSIYAHPEFLQELQQEEQTEVIREKLLTLSGVGPKVADCIMLFSTLKRLDVFPIDVWVRRVMNDLYLHEPDESKVAKAKIERLAKEKYGDLAGIAQQYLFYWRREIS